MWREIPQYDSSVTMRQCDIAASINPPIRVNWKRHSVSQTSVQRQNVTFTLPHLRMVNGISSLLCSRITDEHTKSAQIQVWQVFS
jgi:hypothetical protein